MPVFCWKGTEQQLVHSFKKRGQVQKDICNGDIGRRLVKVHNIINDIFNRHFIVTIEYNMLPI